MHAKDVVRRIVTAWERVGDCCEVQLVLLAAVADESGCRHERLVALLAREMLRALMADQRLLIDEQPLAIPAFYFGRLFVRHLHFKAMKRRMKNEE